MASCGFTRGHSVRSGAHTGYHASCGADQASDCAHARAGYRVDNRSQRCRARPDPLPAANARYAWPRTPDDAPSVRDRGMAFARRVPRAQRQCCMQPHRIRRLMLVMTLIWVAVLAFGTLVSHPFNERSQAASPVPVQGTVAPSRSTGQLGPLMNIPQTWNNCGPSSVAEVLAYWDIRVSQAQVQDVLRADGDPSGMAPFGVPAYMRSLGMRGLLGINGSERLVKALISNGFPVIVDQTISMANRTGHYRPAQAYDDRRQVFIASDPYLGQGHEIGCSAFDTMWHSTNRQFMVLYPPSKQTTLTSVLASAGWSGTVAYRDDLDYQQGVLAGTVADHTDEGAPQNHYLSLAWDALQLQHYAESQQAIERAVQLGANPIVAQWLNDELALAIHA
jgi:predicted double-glycine peptidase